MKQAIVVDEQPVEQGLREILEPFDTQLARASALLPLGLITVVPLTFFIFWLAVDMTGRRSLVIAGGAFCALVAVYMALEMALARLARLRFDHRFPAGTPARALAMRILFEMETPSKAEDRLRVALAGASPDRIIRRRRRTDSGIVHRPTPPPHPTGGSLSVLNPQAAPRPGGYYDYIPLEPRPGDTDLGGERKG